METSSLLTSAQQLARREAAQDAARKRAAKQRERKAKAAQRRESAPPRAAPAAAGPTPQPPARAQVTLPADAATFGQVEELAQAVHLVSLEVAELRGMLVNLSRSTGTPQPAEPPQPAAETSEGPESPA